MTGQKSDDKVVWGYYKTPGVESGLTLMLGLTRAAFESEEGQFVDLTSCDIPLQVQIFKVESRDEAINRIKDQAKKFGYTLQRKL